jgi:4-diphosphocytidyl-2-C-methyl-D-erythritol kinase
VRRFAPAKVNLALHVTGRRQDGYHLLDSLVVFAGVGDWLEIAPAPDLRLSVTGPRAAGVPADRRNLVWRAAEAFGTDLGAAIRLDKHLPHAGGIGGGSADAAAALHGLSALWSLPLPDMAAQLAIGADLPVCVHGRPVRMRGIGEVLDPVPPLPPLWLVLVNPGVEVPTGPVFAALRSVANTAMPAPAWSDGDGFLAWLSATRNDLEGAAHGLVPEVGEVLEALSDDPGCRLARMSGSGGTCFGVFTDAGEAEAAAARLGSRRGGWWIEVAPVLAGAPEGRVS